jgi:hypothetical protein
VSAAGQGPGGYGGPPPGGGYGGPPGGGGFGGPPPDPYGPPNPYGRPHNPWGDPPLPPPPPSGPNLPLILGLGCGGLFLVSLVLGAILLFTMRRPPPAPPPPVAGPTRAAPAPIGGGSTPSGTVKGELRDLRDFKAELGKSRHFVGEIHNTGTEPLGYPSAKVTFYDASDTAIDTSTCSSLVRLLPPGEKIPCTFSTLKADGFVRTRAEVNALRSHFKGSLPNLEVTDVKFFPKAGYKPHTLEGKVKNLSGFRAKHVWAVVSLYGADGKIVGADQALVAGTDLDAGGAALFSAKIYNVAAKPENYTVKVIGYSE